MISSQGTYSGLLEAPNSTMAWSRREIKVNSKCFLTDGKSLLGMGNRKGNKMHTSKVSCEVPGDEGSRHTHIHTRAHTHTYTHMLHGFHCLSTPPALGLGGGM